MVDLEPVDEHRERAQGAADVAPRREDGQLVLLEVAVVRERKALDDREEPGEPPERRPGLAADELRHVGIELLGHHRRACRRGLRERHEAELRGAPDDDLLADPREVPEQDRARIEVVEGEVPVGDRVERVCRLRSGRCRERQCRAGERSRAQRARSRLFRGVGEADQVALEHRCPREEVVPERDRLCPLQMGVAGEERLGLALRKPQDHVREAGDPGARLGAGVRDVEAESSSNLVVARAPRVDLAADGPEETLERRVDVLVAGDEGGALLADGGQTGLDLAQLRVGEEPGLVQAMGVHERRLAVVREELGVVRAEELLHLRRERRLDACGPEGQTGAPFRARAAASSASRAAIWT